MWKCRGHAAAVNQQRLINAVSGVPSCAGTATDAARCVTERRSKFDQGPDEANSGGARREPEQASQKEGDGASGAVGTQLLPVAAPQQTLLPVAVVPSSDRSNAPAVPGADKAASWQETRGGLGGLARRYDAGASVSELIDAQKARRVSFYVASMAVVRACACACRHNGKKLG